jgi:hypothetical protein
MKMLDNCIEIEVLLLNFFDNSSDFEQKNILKEHINNCNVCRNNSEYQDILRTIPRLKLLEPIKTSDDYLEKLQNKIENSESKIVYFKKHLPKSFAVAGFVLILIFSKNFIDQAHEKKQQISKRVATKYLINMDIVPAAYDIRLKSTGIQIRELDISEHKANDIREALKHL